VLVPAYPLLVDHSETTEESASLQPPLPFHCIHTTSFYQRTFTHTHYHPANETMSWKGFTKGATRVRYLAAWECAHTD